MPVSSPTLPLPNSACPFGPAPEISVIRDGPSLPRVSCPTGIDAWLVTRYADVREVLGDTGRFSVRAGMAGHILANTPPDAPAAPGDFSRMDGADHVRFRRALAPAMVTAKRMAAIRPVVRRIVDDALDDLATSAQPVDLHERFAKPVSSAVMAELLGVPASERKLLLHSAEALFRGDADDLEQATAPLYACVQELITRRRTAPAEDVLGVLVGHAGNFTDLELLVAAISVLLAGHDTVASMISHGAFALLAEPSRFALLREDPALIPGAVEETVRLLGVGPGRMRVAVTDTEVAGTPIAAGDYVVVSIQGANHDPAQFPDPGRLDIHRDHRRHLGWGFGPHRCVGQPLAQLELTVVFEALTRRIPSLRLAVPIEDIELKTDTPNTSPAHLPVAWEEIRPG